MMRVLLLVVALASGCSQGSRGLPILSAGIDLGLPAAGDLAVGGAGRDAASGGVDAGAFHAHDKVDILFLVDNSPSMASKQSLLQQGFPAFVAALQGAAATHPASYHIGVVTSDLGAGPFTIDNGQCHPGGDGAKLQAAPSPAATGVPAACSSFALGGGVRFIDYDQVHGTDNLGGVELSTAFGCISSVGQEGCGFESQLEATYQALHGAVLENTGFLRADALLVVFYVTDEDDCSAPPTTDLFDPSAVGNNTYGALHSFRCTQHGIACGNPATAVQPVGSNGPLSMCRPLTMAEGGKLIDAQKYIDFFQKPAAMGGVKVDPSDVILGAIAAPPEPFATISTTPCADQINTASCVILQPSCVQAANSQIHGDPAVRIAAVVNAAATSQQSSACDGTYATPLGALAQKIISRLP